MGDDSRLLELARRLLDGALARVVRQLGRDAEADRLTARMEEVRQRTGFGTRTTLSTSTPHSLIEE